MAVLGVLIGLFGLGALVLSPFAFFQIITKAGYSGWWTLVPYSPWIVAFLGAGVFRTVDTSESIGTTFDQLGLWLVLTFLTGAFVTVMFFVFAFSAWPSLQQPRSRRGFSTGLPPGGSGPPSWGPPRPSSAMAPASAGGPFGGQPATSGPSPEQPSGWYRSGTIGAGEQSYWDGQAWTGKRKWSNSAWVELPMDAVGPSQAGPAGTGS
jgi:hypothetical protein